MISRFKELVNYPNKSIVDEVMMQSEKFNSDIETNPQSKIVFLEIAEDKENTNENKLYAVMLFNRRETKIPQLYYYFSVYNHDMSKITSDPAQMYKRSETGKYVPSEMTGQGLITNKINEMFKKLITMDKPITFEMKTDESLPDKSLMRFDKLESAIINSGYAIMKKEKTLDGKMYWKFSQKTNEELENDLNESELFKNPNFLTEELKEKISDHADLIGFFKRKKLENNE